MGSNEGRARGTTALVLLTLMIALLTAILLAGQVAEAKPGGGGGGKPSGSVSKPSNVGSGKVSGEKGLPPGVADPASPYYGSPRYGVRHGALSNFFLWSWLFHDRDDEEYEEEYVQANHSSGGWVVMATGLLAVVGFPLWALQRCAKG